MSKRYIKIYNIKYTVNNYTQIVLDTGANDIVLIYGVKSCSTDAKRMSNQILTLCIFFCLADGKTHGNLFENQTSTANTLK